MGFPTTPINPGDITAVTAGVGMSGGGTSGAVTLNIDAPVGKSIGGTGNTAGTVDSVVGTPTASVEGAGVSGAYATGTVDGTGVIAAPQDGANIRVPDGLGKFSCLWFNAGSTVPKPVNTSSTHYGYADVNAGTPEQIIGMGLNAIGWAAVTASTGGGNVCTITNNAQTVAGNVAIDYVATSGGSALPAPWAIAGMAGGVTAVNGAVTLAAAAGSTALTVGHAGITSTFNGTPAFGSASSWLSGMGAQPANTLGTRPMATTAPSVGDVPAWSGSTWAPASSSPFGKRTLTVNAALLQAVGGGATTFAWDIGAVLPLNARITGYTIGEGVCAAFDNPGHADFHLYIGGADPQDIMTSMSVSVTGGTFNPVPQSPWIPDVNTSQTFMGALGFPYAPQSGQQLTATMITGGGALSSCTVGSVVINVFYTVLA